MFVPANMTALDFFRPKREEAPQSYGDPNVTWQDFAKKYLKYSTPMASHHAEVWDWAQALQDGQSSESIVLCLGRGGGKSSTAEGAIPFVGMRKSRRFALYVSGTQEQAVKHLNDIAQIMSERIGVERKTDKYGHSKGWSTQKLRVSDGFTVVALGLDVASRGMKVDGARPDLIILDDIDDEMDSYDMVQRKCETIKNAIIPTMSTSGTVMFVQNAIHANSIMQMFLDGRNDFLIGAKVVGPIPAVYNLEVERAGLGKYVVTGGTPSWEGQNLKVCETQINQWGLRAFLREAQHEIHDPEGALWTRETLGRNRVWASMCPQFKRVAIGVDPAVTNKATSDESGIVVAALGYDDIVYIIDDKSGHYSVGQFADKVYRMWGHYDADAIVIETNQGGDFVEAQFLQMDPNLPIVRVVAHEGKKIRAQPVAALYEEDRVKHVLWPEPDEEENGISPSQGRDDTLKRLEVQMTTWDPEMRGKSPDRIDALVMAVMHVSTGIMHGSGRVHNRYKAR